MLRAVVIAFVLVLLNAAPLSSKTASVSIEALYRERMLLPERATLRVRLTDAESGNVIASTTLDNPHVPVHLELSYEPSNIDNAHVYTVTAQIAVNGEPFFATSSPAKVITRGNPSQVELLLERVTAESATMLEDGQWALLELHGRAVIAEHRPFLAMSAGHASGSGGCNRFSGGYKLSGNNRIHCDGNHDDGVYPRTCYRNGNRVFQNARRRTLLESCGEAITASWQGAQHVDAIRKVRLVRTTSFGSFKSVSGHR